MKLDKETKQEIKRLKKEKKFEEIYNRFGSKIYVKSSPRFYMRRLILELIKEEKVCQARSLILTSPKTSLSKFAHCLTRERTIYFKVSLLHLATIFSCISSRHMLLFKWEVLLSWGKKISLLQN